MGELEVEMRKRYNIHKQCYQGSLLTQKVLRNAVTKEDMLQVVNKNYRRLELIGVISAILAVLLILYFTGLLVITILVITLLFLENASYQPISVMWLDNWQIKLAMALLLGCCYYLCKVTEIRLNRLADEVDDDQLRKDYLSKIR